MRRILYIAIAAIITSCTMWEQSTTTELLRPGAAVRTDSVNTISLYVFDEHDTLTFFEQLLVEGKIDSLPIVDGVPEGNYRVVSFVNCSRYEFEPMTLGKSSYADLECEMTNFVDSLGNPISTSDSILYGNQFVTAHWGWGSRAPVQILTRQLYYNMGVRIKVADNYDFWGAVSMFSLELRRLPRRFDKEGVSGDPSVKFTVTEFDLNDPGKVAARLRLPRFTDSDRVELHAVSNGYSLGSVVLLPSKFGVDPASPNPIEFTVDMNILPREIEISIEGWAAGVIQTTTIGQ